MAIENTTNNPRPEWVLGGDPESIERQEAQGQAQLARSSQLPADGLTPELAAKHQIQIVGPSKGDALFVDVKLPKGTEVRPTDHSMWSELFAGDVKIASIFYKAAFYDRCAFIRFEND
jgi:hypothetical protein